MSPTEENVKNLILDPILAQIYIPIFFSEALSQLVVTQISKRSS